MTSTQTLIIESLTQRVKDFYQGKHSVVVTHDDGYSMNFYAPNGIGLLMGEALVEHPLSADLQEAVFALAPRLTVRVYADNPEEFTYRNFFVDFPGNLRISGFDTRTHNLENSNQILGTVMVLDEMYDAVVDATPAFVAKLQDLREALEP